MTQTITPPHTQENPNPPDETPSGSARFLSRRQLAKRWAVSVQAIVKWERAGRLTATRFGAAVRYAVEQVEAIERANTTAVN